MRTGANWRLDASAINELSQFKESHVSIRRPLEDSGFGIILGSPNTLKNSQTNNIQSFNSNNSNSG